MVRKANTYSHRQYNSKVYIQSYDQKRMIEMIYSSDHSEKIRSFFKPLNNGNILPQMRNDLDPVFLTNLDNVIVGKNHDHDLALLHEIESLRLDKLKIILFDVEIAKYIGLNIIALILLGIICYYNKSFFGFRIINIDGSSCLTIGYDEDSSSIVIEMFHIESDLLWNEGYLSIPKLPEAISIGLEGKNLKYLIEYPLFDKLNISIKSVETKSNKTLIETDYSPQYKRVNYFIKNILSA